MTINQQKRQQLLSLKKAIMLMPNSADRMNLINSYASLFDYYRIGFKPNEVLQRSLDIDDEFLSTYYKRLKSATEKRMAELADLAPSLYLKFNTLIREYQKNNFYSYEFGIFDKINQKELYDIVSDFFILLGQDVCNLFGEIVSKENVSLIDLDEFDGASMNSIYVDSPCMILNNIEKYLNYYFALVHEVGHCYQFYLQRNHQLLENINPFMEATSILFEKMFAMFLSDMNIYKKVLFNKELESNIYLLNDLSISKLICDLLMKNDVYHVNPQTLSYDCSLSPEEMEDKVTRDCGYVLKNRKHYGLDSIQYAIGEWVATYFINKMQTNFLGTWQEYKNFISTVNDYPAQELLEKYMDENVMLDRIKTFIKSYQSR